MRFSLREGIKMLVLAPAGAALGYILTDILYALAVSSGALPSDQPYALIVGAVAFAIIVVSGMDKVILDE